MESDSNLERNVWIEHCKHSLKDTKFQFLYSTTMLVLECDIVRNNDAKIIIKRIITLTFRTCFCKKIYFL